MASASGNESGAMPYAASWRISIQIPPRPQFITGPNWGSRIIPKDNSISCRWNGLTRTPRTFIPPDPSETRRENAFLTASSLSIGRMTPPSSVLWRMSGDTTFITMGKPISVAAERASSSVWTNRFRGTEIPYTSKRPKASGSNR